MKEKGLKCLSLVLVLIVSFAILSVASAPVKLPKVYMVPEQNVVNPGDYFFVAINIDDVVDLYSYGIKISWERDLLECTDVTEGGFVAGSAPEGTAFIKVISNDYIDIGCTILGDYPTGASGSGNLMMVSFRVIDAGPTELDIYYSRLLDPADPPNAIPHTVEDGYFETPVAANLVKKSAWPEHHHFDISTQLAKDGDSNQSLYAKVKNVGPIGFNLYVYVVFEIVRDNGVIGTPTSDVVVVMPGTIVDLTVDFGPLVDLDAGKHYVSASCWYSWNTTLNPAHPNLHWAQGKKIKTFSFAVVS